MMFSDRSLTAEAAALSRALGTTDSRLPVRCEDHLARLVVHPLLRWLLRNGPLRRALRWLLERFAPGLYAWHCLRTAYFDAHIRRALEGGVRQLVILGAGLDTRAFRLCGDLFDATVFEIDRTSNAARKTETLKGAGVATRVTHRLVRSAVGEEGGSLTRLLETAGFDRGAPAFVLCEGLLMYLDDGSRDDLLSEIAALSDEVVLAFDFVDAAAMQAPRGSEASRVLISAAAVGEVYRSGMRATRLPELLGNVGFELREQLGPDALASRGWGDRRAPYAVSACSSVALAESRRGAGS